MIMNRGFTLYHREVESTGGDAYGFIRRHRGDFLAASWPHSVDEEVAKLRDCKSSRI